MPLTYFLAQIIGLFCLIIGLSLLQKRVFVEVVDSLLTSRGLMYIVGIISLILGLLVVLTHNIWNGGTLALVITLIGWAMILKGTFALFLSHDTLTSLVHSSKLKKHPWVFGIVLLLIGMYLTYAGLVG